MAALTVEKEDGSQQLLLICASYVARGMSFADAVEPAAQVKAP